MLEQNYSICFAWDFTILNLVSTFFLLALRYYIVKCDIKVAGDTTNQHHI